jgi:gliding motility-associated transport system ATP-binding protein
LVQVDHLTKKYGDVAAITDVTFSAEKGEILGFLGPNAAGKTTTMRIVTGFMPPTSGTASIAGYDVVDEALEARQRLGYLPENVPLYEDMTVGGYLTFYAKLRGVSSGKMRDRVEYVMEATRITGEANTIIGKLSKGFRQRVGIAQAMVHNPDVLILDEPTVGLDPRQIIEIRELIRGLRGEHTIILSTHILPEAQMLCDRIVIINEGRIVAVDRPENLTARLRKSQQIRLEVRGPAAEVEAQLKALPHVMAVRRDGAAVGRQPSAVGPAKADSELPDSRQPTADSPTVFFVDGEVERDIREVVAGTVVKHGWGLLEMNSVRMNLEDIFLSLTTEEEASGLAISSQRSAPTFGS